jgi:hypothetical protein
MLLLVQYYTAQVQEQVCSAHPDLDGWMPIQNLSGLEPKNC